MGRPSTFTPDISAQICEQVATSMDGLQTICDRLGLKMYTVLCWMTASHPNYIEEFALDYARAKEMQADMMAERILQAASTERIGQKVKTTKEGEEITTGDMVDRSRLEVDALKWVAARLKPKSWGDKIDVTSGGDKLSQSVIILPAKGSDNGTDNKAEKS